MRCVMRRTRACVKCGGQLYYTNRPKWAFITHRRVQGHRPHIHIYFQSKQQDRYHNQGRWVDEISSIDGEHTNHTILLTSIPAGAESQQPLISSLRRRSSRYRHCLLDARDFDFLIIRTLNIEVVLYYCTHRQGLSRTRTYIRETCKVILTIVAPNF